MCARALLSLLIVAGLVSGCAPESEPPAPLPGSTAPPELWAAEAVAWNTAMAEVADFPNLIPQFFAENVVLDDRPGGLRQVVQGREDYLDYSIQQRGFTVPFVFVDYFLSADEELQYKTLDTTAGIVDVLSRMTFGSQGVESTIETYSVRKPTWISYDHLDELAQRYVSFWNGRSDVPASSLYEDDASIEDTLLGHGVSGIGAITGGRDDGLWPDLPDMRIQLLPTDEGPAVFIGPSGDSALGDEINLLVDADDGSGCPGQMGISLNVHSGRITRESRFHHVSSVRRCFEPPHLMKGWWEGIAIPEPVRHERSGLIATPGLERAIVVYNGNEHADDLIRWGMARFHEAGLPPPRVVSIAFLFDPEFCSDRGGLAVHREEGSTISLCFEARHVCADEDCRQWTLHSRHLLLHELAHAWVADHVGEDTRSEFISLEGVEHWYHPDDSWEDRGVERAANTLMFGLMDEVGIYGPAGWGSCERWGPGFRFLTGVEPITPDCEKRAARLTNPATDAPPSSGGLSTG